MKLIMFKLQNRLLTFLLAITVLLTSNHCELSLCVSSNLTSQDCPCERSSSDSCEDTISCQAAKVGMLQNQTIIPDQAILISIPWSEIFAVESELRYQPIQIYSNESLSLPEYEPITIHAPNSPPAINL